MNNVFHTQTDLLPQGETCQVFHEEKLIFTSQSHWLHPLFELNEFLENSRDFNCPPARENLYLRDRIIGRAAALMIVKMNIIRCASPLISERALPIFEMYHVSVDYDETVPRLPCQTEDILASVTNAAEAWEILAKRADAAKEAQR